MHIVCTRARMCARARLEYCFELYLFSLSSPEVHHFNTLGEQKLGKVVSDPHSPWFLSSPQLCIRS